jgi:hypothetical protein
MMQLMTNIFRMFEKSVLGHTKEGGTGCDELRMISYIHCTLHQRVLMTMMLLMIMMITRKVPYDLDLTLL